MSESIGQRKLAAIMFTDMVGFSALSQRDEALALALLAEHRGILRNVFARHAGREIKTTGDGFLIEFPSALSAVQAAVAMQEALHARNVACAPERVVKIRVGIHVGDVVASEGDIHGDGVNIAARIEPLAPSGGICLSEDVARAVRNKVSFPLSPLGPTELKNIDLPVSVFRVVLPWDATTPSESVAPAMARRAAPTNAVAVLPFADLSEAKDQAYLCEGMAEEIMNALVQVDGIRVASRTSSFRAKQNNIDLPAIARALAVGHILEGSVRTSGSRMRVTAQLTDVASGFQLWSERFDREAADIFAVQDEIAAGVMEAVKERLAPGQKSIHPRPRVKNLEAYRSFLKGRHLRGKEHHEGALRAFEEAVRLDPSHAPAWTGLAEVTVLASVFGVIPAREACATARRALATARDLQGESADGLHVEAFVAWIERKWAAMEVAWNRAIRLQPNHVLALASFGLVLCTRQRLDEGLQLLERARQADPLASFPYSLTGAGLINCGRPQDALRHLDDALSFEAEDATALDNAGIAKVALGRFEEGIAMFEHVVAVSQRGAHFLGTLGWALATAGRKSEARTILEELRARPPGAPVVVSQIWLLGALGELDAAFEVVARAEEECMANVYFTGSPAFDSLRADPRFVALEKRLGLDSRMVDVGGISP